MTIRGLRFRRVLLNEAGGYVSCDARISEVCDAMVCRRCTAVLRDDGEAERHVCVTRYWQAGFSFGDIDRIDAPDRMRERVQVANGANLADLWPHQSKLVPRRKLVSLAERYELLSVLFAELAKMERGAEARPRRRARR